MVADVLSRRLSIIIGMFVMGLGFVIEGAFPFFAPTSLATALPLLIRTIRFDQQEEVAISEVVVAEQI